jgi:hypothetical protein
MHIRTAVVAVSLAVASAVAVFAQGPRRDGRWEVTMQMEMPGMPANMPPIKTEQCITPEMAKNPEMTIPKSQRGENPNNCKVSDYKTEGNTVSWTMKCEGQHAMSGTGKITYAGDEYKGEMTMETGGRTMKMTYSGKRLGDCVK